MEIKAADVKTLREKTGAGMMECKKALMEAEGDFAAAETILKEKGLAAVEKRADRDTSEGVVMIRCENGRVLMIELTCETDFVAKNADFLAVGTDILNTAFDQGCTEVTQELTDKMLDLATRVRENMGIGRFFAYTAQPDEYIAKYVHSDKKTGVVIVLKADKPEVFASSKEVQDFAYDCCLHVAAFTPLYVDRAAVEQKYIDEQTEIFTAQVAQLDKPDNVKAGIVQGKLKKHLSDICFLEQPFVKDDKVSVAKKMEEVGKAAGAKISLSKMVLFQLGGK